MLDAAAAVASIYARSSELLGRVGNGVLRDLGVPDSALDLARAEIDGLCMPVIARADLAHVDGEYKLLEYNVDAPGLIVEAFSMNGVTSSWAGCPNPNAGAEQTLAAALFSAVQKGAEYVGKAAAREAGIAISVAGRDRRDRDIAQYLASILETSEHVNARVVALESLVADDTGLYDDIGIRIDVLVRCHLMQYLGNGSVRHRGAGRDLVFDDVRHLIVERRLAIVNPPSGLVLQSKAVQALVWALAEARMFFTDEERSLIERYFLASYLDVPPFRPYVIKPVFGSNGDSIRVVGRDGNVAYGSTLTTHLEERSIYQRWVPLPVMEAVTEEAVSELDVVASCFVVGGIPSAVILRAGFGVTDNSWWVVPVHVSA